MEREKQVDESWKDTVAQEKKDSKEKDTQSTPEEQPTQGTAEGAESSSHGQEEDAAEYIEINFVNYVTSLVIQAMIFLGQMPNPLAENKVETNLKQAKFLIDTLILIREKTQGNLSQEEENILNHSLYELQMKYVELSNKKEENKIIS